MFSRSSSAHERCDARFCKLCCKTRCCSQGRWSSGGASLTSSQAGALDDDAARFEKIVLAMPEPSRLLPVYEAVRAALNGPARGHCADTCR